MSLSASSNPRFFVVVLTHTRPLDEVDRHLPAHFAFLDQAYAQGVFLLSGKRVPRSGAVILAQASSIEDIEKYLEQEPFLYHEVSRHQVYEFVPGRSAPDLSVLQPR
ncbi:GTP cyclohydrolase [Pseudomonas sp. D5002]|uniref:YciI family protein n=1 Tax=Pseudomonas sp. D5002 TaxID=2738818 RepID=UPI0015A49809|nr:YciI family protein [Pseudomonas sp. D5002]NWB09101.1 GTP cyclohydrolase [Pseudomonas sp. D5002]